MSLYVTLMIDIWYLQCLYFKYRYLVVGELRFHTIINTSIMIRPRLIKHILTSITIKSILDKMCWLHQSVKSLSAWNSNSFFFFLLDPIVFFYLIWCKTLITTKILKDDIYLYAMQLNDQVKVTIQKSIGGIQLKGKLLFLWPYVVPRNSIQTTNISWNNFNWQSWISTLFWQ